jgi:7-cyano-7-deazaguanine synthase
MARSSAAAGVRAGMVCESSNRIGDSPAPVPLVVLFGSGIESTTLVKRSLTEGKTVLPVYQHWGLPWEDCELLHAHRFCQANACDHLHPLVEVRHSHREMMEGHWAASGGKAPQTGDSPQALEIPLRNLTLLVVATARLAHLPELHLVMGTTADNHFSDGTREFFDACERLLCLQFARPVRILTPLLGFDKVQVIRQSDRKTLALSFSCLAPRNGLHCGTCYKCGRRRSAFRQAGVDDPTVYAVRA